MSDVSSGRTTQNNASTRHRLAGRSLVLLAGLLFISGCSHQTWRNALLPQPINTRIHAADSLLKDAPALAQASRWRPQKVEHFRLDSGLPVVLLRSQQAVNGLSWVAFGSAARADDSKLLELFMDHWRTVQLKHKTARSDRIAASFGTSISRWRGDGNSVWYARVFTRDLQPMVKLLINQALQPEFDPRELERARLAIGVHNAVDGINGYVQSWRLFRLLTLAPGSPDRESAALASAADARRALTPPALAKLWRAYNRIHHYQLLLLSRLSRAEISKRLSGMTPQAVVSTQRQTQVNQLNPNTHFATTVAIERAGSTQVNVRIGTQPQHLTLTERQALKLAAEELAGSGLSSRLNRDLRERQGLSYGFWYRLNRLGDWYSLQILGGGEPYKLAALISGMRAHLKALFQNGLTRQRFDTLKHAMLNQAHFSLSTRGGQLSAMVRALDDPPSTALDRDSEALRQLSYADFQGYLQKFAQFRWLTLLSGDRKAISHYYCEYYQQCNISWFNNALERD